MVLVGIPSFVLKTKERHTADTTEAEEPLQDTALTHPILFFDGICGLCNRSVDLLLRIDKEDVFRFAPLQGETARRMQPPLTGDPEIWSILYLDENGLHDQSDVTMQVCRRLGGLWGLVGLLRIMPVSIRNAAYRFVARNCYSWFGKHDTCRLPTPQEQARFLP